MKLDAFAAIVEEHDAQFPVKKVSPFLDNGSGGLVRQTANSSGAANVSTAGYGAVTSVSATNNTAGTAVQLASAACSMVEIFNPAGNTGQIAVGGSNSKAASGSEVGVILFQGASNRFYVSNANLLWFDVATNGDKISYNIYA